MRVKSFFVLLLFASKFSLFFSLLNFPTLKLLLYLLCAVVALSPSCLILGNFPICGFALQVLRQAESDKNMRELLLQYSEYSEAAVEEARL